MSCPLGLVWVSESARVEFTLGPEHGTCWHLGLDAQMGVFTMTSRLLEDADPAWADVMNSFNGLIVERACCG